MSVAAPSRVRPHAFGRTRDGRAVSCWTLQAEGMVAEVLDYGAVLRGLWVPDAAGRAADVVLGYDTMEAYERDRFYLGAAVGRVAGRTGGAAFTLDGRRYALPANDGANHLHGGPRGLHTAVWRAEPFEEGDTVGLVLSHTSPDGDDGYPGTLDVSLTYALSPDGVLALEFRAETDRATPVSLTHHAYFNLGGDASDDVLGHALTLHASAFTPVDASLLPTGEIAPVAWTPLDFRTPRPIGARIGADHGQMRIGAGYDHFFVLDGEAGTLRPAAHLHDPASGRSMEMWTTEPGLQLYSGNFLDGSIPGKGGRRHGRRAGVCLETQRFPNAVNRPEFPTSVLRPGETRVSRTELRFPGAAER